MSAQGGRHRELSAFIAAVFSFLMFIFFAITHAQSIPDLTPYINNANGADTVAGGNASQVDLLVESNSYTPPFYRGRALASPGSTLTLQAIAGFATPDTITYTWSRNGSVEGSVSGKGKSVATFPAPSLFATDTFSVDARASDGSAYGNASIAISSTDPQITLYIDHPLFGIEYYDALGAKNSIGDIESTFAAVPYFVAASSLAEPQFAWNWSINGTPLTATSSGNRITLSAQNSTGVADLALSLTSRINPLLDAEGAWSLLLSPSVLPKAQTH